MVPAWHKVRQVFVGLAGKTAGLARELLNGSRVLSPKSSRGGCHPERDKGRSGPVGLCRCFVVDAGRQQREVFVEIVV